MREEAGWQCALCMCPSDSDSRLSVLHPSARLRLQSVHPSLKTPYLVEPLPAWKGACQNPNRPSSALPRYTPTLKPFVNALPTFAAPCHEVCGPVVCGRAPLNFLLPSLPISARLRVLLHPHIKTLEPLPLHFLYDRLRWCPSTHLSGPIQLSSLRLRPPAAMCVVLCTLPMPPPSARLL